MLPPHVSAKVSRSGGGLLTKARPTERLPLPMDPHRIANLASEGPRILEVTSFEMPSSIKFEFYFFWSGLTQTRRLGTRRCLC